VNRAQRDRHALTWKLLAPLLLAALAWALHDAWRYPAQPDPAGVEAAP